MIPFAQAAAQAAQSECGLSKWFCGTCDSNCGLIFYGVLIGFAICLVIWLIATIHARNKNVCKDITIEDSDKGNFVISANAMKTFAEKIVSENNALKFVGLKLLETRLGLVMKVSLSAQPDAELLSLRKDLRDRIFKEMEEKLGITDQIAQINFEVNDFEKAVEEKRDETTPESTI
ncbi:MAG: hypothetical protein IKP00_06200 [Victivallales bacterium]|nr:hypothetical protein [Victivallales bacterium]